MEDVRLHDLRHSQAVMKGIPLPVVSKRAADTAGRA